MSSGPVGQEDGAGESQSCSVTGQVVGTPRVTAIVFIKLGALAQHFIVMISQPFYPPGRQPCEGGLPITLTQRKKLTGSEGSDHQRVLAGICMQGSELQIHAWSVCWLCGAWPSLW